MTGGLETVWGAAKFMAELVGKGALKQGAAKAVAWLLGKLPEEAKPAVEAVQAAPGSEPAQAALALQINALLEAQPKLLAELRGLLAETRGDSSITQTVGNQGTGVVNQGDNNKVTITR